MKRTTIFQSILTLACCALFLTAQFSAKVFAQDAFRVTDVSLKPDTVKNLKCPARVVFNGYITANAAGTVKYTFVRSDEAEADVMAIEFKKAGTMAVSTSWTIGSAARTTDYEGWEAIKILSPNETESSHEAGAFAVHCKAGGVQEVYSQPGPIWIVNPARGFEKIELKQGEKLERDGQIAAGQKSYVYAVHLEKGQSVNLAAVFRGNFNEDKPNAVFRGNFIPSVEIRGLYKSGDKDAPPIVGATKDGKWSGAINEAGDYLIVVSRPVAKEGDDDGGGEQAVFPYKLLVWTN